MATKSICDKCKFLWKYGSKKVCNNCKATTVKYSISKKVCDYFEQGKNIRDFTKRKNYDRWGKRGKR